MPIRARIGILTRHDVELKFEGNDGERVSYDVIAATAVIAALLCHLHWARRLLQGK